MVNNKNYKIAEISFPDNKNSYQIDTIRDSLSQYLGGTDIGVELRKSRDEFNTIEVYIPQHFVNSQMNSGLQPLTTKLQEFKERHSKSGAPAQLALYDITDMLKEDIRDREMRNKDESLRLLQNEVGQLRQSKESLDRVNSRLIGNYETAQNNIEELKEQLGTLPTELEESRQYVSNLEQVVSSLRENSIIESATLENFTKILHGNEHLYFSTQNNMITSVFHQVSGEVDKREFYEKLEDVNKAKETIKRRDKYLAGPGQTALELLPPSARELTQKEWENAESLIADYEQYQEGIPTLNVPIRLSKTTEGVSVVIPVNPKSNYVVAKTLYDKLVAYGDQIKSELKLEVSFDDKQPFATLNITGEIDNKTIEDRLFSTFGEVAEQAKLNLQTFQTSYLISATETGSTEHEKVNPGEYIRSRIKEIGYASQKQFTIENPDVKGIRDILYSLSHGRGVLDKTIEKLASALKMDKSDLEAVIKGYSVKPSWEESPVNGDESLSPEKVNPADYIKSRIKDLGYIKHKKFSNDNPEIKGLGTILHRLSRGNKLQYKTLQSLATALKIDMSELETIINNYSISTPEEVVPVSDGTPPSPSKVDPGAYLKSKIRELYGSQEHYRTTTGHDIRHTLHKLRQGDELTDEEIKKTANNLKGVRWDTLKREIGLKK